MLALHELTTPALAYLGDCVLEMCVRRYLVQELGLSTSAHLNKAALQYVCAPAQSSAVSVIEPYLTQEELAVYKRGRNMGHSNVPRSATVQEYRRATGMEVLFGHLSVQGNEARIRVLFRAAYGIERPEALGLTPRIEPCPADSQALTVTDTPTPKNQTKE